MRTRLGTHGAPLLATFAGLATPALAEQVIAVTADNTLITFDTTTPLLVDSARPLRGIVGNVAAIDLRPSDGMVYALTDLGRLFRVDPATGNATEVGTGPLSIDVAGHVVGMDFDPTTDRIRIVTDRARNLRVDPDDGSVEDGDPAAAGTQPDADLVYAPGDVGSGVRPNVVAAAHTNVTSGAARTSAFVIDSNLDVLARLGDESGGEASRNSGRLHTIGILGVNATGFAAFDVSRTSGTAYAVLTPAGQPASRLYVVSLLSGAASSLGAVGDARPIRAMTLGPALSPSPSPSRELVGLTLGGELVRFRSDNPGVITSRVTVTGLLPGDTLVAIDVRPGNGRLYGLSGGSRLYLVNADTGVASAIRETPFEVLLEGTEFGFDFNVAGDRARIVSDSDQNLRVAPDTGAAVDGDAGAAGTQPDTRLAFAADDRNGHRDPNVVGVASDRNAAGSATTLFGIDTNLDVLVRLGSPQGAPDPAGTGLLHTIGGLGVDATGLAGFEIAGDSSALAALTTPGATSRLYVVDLTTGVATLLGNVGSGETLRGLSVAPTSNPPAGGDVLRVRRMAIKFDHDTADRDAIEIAGSLPLPPGALLGRTVTVDVGGFSHDFVLGRRGMRRDRDGTAGFRDDDVFRFGAPRDGRLPFEVQFRREDVSDELADEGMRGDADVVRQPRTVRLTITVDGTPFTTLVSLRYSATAGRSGLATTD